jgi:hypothetical protein
MKSIENDTRMISEAWTDKVKQNVQNFAQSKTGKALGAAGKQFANAATFNTLGAAEDAAKIAAGTDTDSQLNALNQKDQAHDQMDQQNTQTDQSQEQRIAQLEQIIQQLQAQVQQLTGGQAQAAPASAPVNTTPQAPASPNAPIPGQA